MGPVAPINAVSAAIQLAIAPVFLLTGIGAILAVLTTRLGRVIDRARLIERRTAQASSEEHRDLLQTETVALWRRIKIINWAMRLAVSSALIICIVIMSLFVSAYVAFGTGALISVLFVSAMLLLVAALLCLLLEVSILTKKMLQGVAELIVDDEVR